MQIVYRYYPKLKGPFCQSCSATFEFGLEFGTNFDGSNSKDYCIYCFQNGKFKEPEITLEKMMGKIAICYEDQMKMSPQQAEDAAKRIIPFLKRWKS